MSWPRCRQSSDGYCGWPSTTISPTRRSPPSPDCRWEPSRATCAGGWPGYADDGRWTVTHLNRDRLVLIAIGDDLPDHGEEMHLAACDTCHEELTRTDKVADLARHGPDLLDLPAPSIDVWDRVAAEAFTPSRPEP